MRLRKILGQIGLSSHEAQLYLTSLELGPATISEIARQAKLPRTTSYPIIASLEKRGLISSSPRKRRRYWRAENPNKLLFILKEQEAVLIEAIPRMKTLHREAGARPTIRFYENISGILVIFDDILAQNQRLRTLTSIDDAVRVLGDDFEDFIERRIQRRIPARLLTPETDLSRKMQKEDPKSNRRTRFLPEKEEIKTATFIYGNNVALISFNRKQPMGLIIEDEDIAHTQRFLFNSLWEKAAK